MEKPTYEELQATLERKETMLREWMETARESGKENFELKEKVRWLQSLIKKLAD